MLCSIFLLPANNKFGYMVRAAVLRPGRYRFFSQEGTIGRNEKNLYLCSVRGKITSTRKKRTQAG